MTSVAVGGLKPYPLTAVDVRGLEIDRRQGADLEMDRAGGAQDLRRVRLGSPPPASRRAPARRSSSGASTARPPKRWPSATPCAKPSASTTIPSPPSCRSSRASFCTGQGDRRSNAARPKAFCAASCASRGWTTGRGSTMTINFQNEWIVAHRDGAAIAMSPDLICVLDSVSGEAVGKRDHPVRPEGHRDRRCRRLRFSSRRAGSRTLVPAPLAMISSSGACLKHETNRHRCRRHQYRRRPDRRRQGGGCGEGADQRGRDDGHPGLAEESRYPPAC